MSEIILDLKQVDLLVKMFGGDDTSISIKKIDGKNYAYYTEYPEEGSVCLEEELEND